MKPTIGARVLELTYRSGQSIIHFNYLDFAHFTEKLNRYTTIEAFQAHECGRRSSYAGMLKSILKEFLKRYLIQSGYRDGWRGVYLTAFMMFYRIAVQAKLKEIEVICDRYEIQKHYNAEAEEVINGYK